VALPDTLAFMQLLWAVDHGLRSLSKRMHHTLGITGPQRLCLRMLGRTPGAAPSELAAQLHIDRGTLSGILERLVRAGLVRRTADPRDGRRARLELTGALNLDGGGSTTMVAKGHVVNRPSDPVGPRPVSDAIVVTLK